MPGSVEGGGVVARFIRDLQLRNQMFTPHSVISVGRDTHFPLEYDKNSHFLRKNNLPMKFPRFREIFYHFRETWRSCSISGDSRKFRETWQFWCMFTLGLFELFLTNVIDYLSGQVVY